MGRAIVAADLFAGAGGTSTALRAVCDRLGRKLKLTAVNHLPITVETHAANHPGADHLCATLDSVDPRKACGRRIDVLVASPECTHHSNARGGKPCDDQSRATAWHVVRWAEALRPAVILVENVREMLTWGPLGADGRPLKSRKGETFAAWVNALVAVGYTVASRLVNAADFGGATTRTRLFVMAVRGRRAVPWPAPTHEKEPKPNLLGSLPRWRAAREVIDWTLSGKSVFGRKVPLKENTVRRIAEGIRRFWGCDPEPFLVRLRGTAAGQVKASAVSAHSPVPTLTGGGEHVGVCSPFVMPTTHHGKGRTRGIGDPLPTVTGANRGEQALVEPLLMSAGGPRVGPISTAEPMNTVLTRDHMAVVEPFILNTGQTNGRGSYVYAGSRPAPTITSADQHAVAQPFILPPEGVHRGNAPRAVDEQPLQTITAGRGGGHLIEPFLVKYNATGKAHPVADPLDTLSTRDRFGLVTPAGLVTDILFRMLQPHELAAAMGFPAGYVFKGTREQVVKQIGNAVEVHKATAHLYELLRLVAA